LIVKSFSLIFWTKSSISLTSKNDVNSSLSISLPTIYNTIILLLSIKNRPGEYSLINLAVFGTVAGNNNLFWLYIESVSFVYYTCNVYTFGYTKFIISSVEIELNLNY